MKTVTCFTVLLAVGYATPQEPNSLCTQPKVVGPCRAALPRFFYNSETSKCEQFFYGGCDGNGNNFMTQQACEESCNHQNQQNPTDDDDVIVDFRLMTEVREPLRDICSQDKAVGPCRAAFPRFYYNHHSGQCDQFIYGGCEGNENNFRTQQDCKHVCTAVDRRVPDDDICSQRKEIGPCRAAFPRYFFNQTTRQCEQFIYGGCDGNENNFRSEEVCKAICPVDVAEPQERITPSILSAGICSQDKLTGPCKGTLLRYFFNKESKKCESFLYGGCDGNQNNFRSEHECNTVCSATAPEVRVDVDQVCKQEKTVGPCRGAFPRFYYDASSGKCEPFFYGGCDGNQNNFLTQQECNAVCSAATREQDVSAAPLDAAEVCAQAKEVGPCRGAFLRFYFNQHSGQCEQFLYGGCDGNQNNFKNQQSCERTCDQQVNSVIEGRRMPDARKAVNKICTQEQVVGPCRAALPRFYYNTASGKCELFLYGGCDGNQNNFRSEQECNTVCSVPEDQLEFRDEDDFTPSPVDVNVVNVDVCTQDKVVGPCRAAISRFYFNRQSGQCEKFLYGGCFGNQNNFRSEQECSSACAVVDDQKQGEEEEEVLQRDPHVVCFQPSDDGGCRAAFPRFFFNKDSNTCEEFLYGGCKGNENRFNTKESCEQFCKPVMQ